MTPTVRMNSQRPDLLYDLSLSIYTSLLFVWFEESKPFAWPTRYLYFWHPHAVGLRRSDFLLFYLEAFLIVAAVIFLVLRLLRFFSSTKLVPRAVGGVVALGGFPSVCLNRKNTLPLVGALLIAGVCFLLWARRKWVVSTPLTIVLLVLYFAFCSFVGGGIPLESRPIGGWRIWDYSWLAFPALGFAYTLLWAKYFRQSEAQAR